MTIPHFLLPNLDVGRVVVGIFGSAVTDSSIEAVETAKIVGRLLGSMGLRVATGGCVGLPAVAARAARSCGAKLIGFFPDKDATETLHNSVIHANDSVEIYDDIYYAVGYSNRSLQMIKSIDCAIVIGGRTGTLSEWAMALEEGLPVLVINNSGGIASHLEHILALTKKEFPNNYIAFSNDVQLGVAQLIAYVGANKFRRIKR